MTNRTLPRRFGPLLVAGLLAATACTGGDEQPSASAPADGADDTTATDGASDAPAVTASSEPEPEPEPQPEPTTSTSSTTTTTLPLRATVTSTELPSRSEAGRLDDLGGYAVTTGDREVVHFAATSLDGPGADQRAKAFSTTDGRVFTEVPLDGDGALESSAADVASDGGDVLVGGTTIGADGTASAAIWISNDSGATYSQPLRPIDPARASRLIALDRTTGVTYALLGTLDGDDPLDPYTFVMAVGVDGVGWTEFAFDVAEPSDGDVTVMDGTVAVVLTAQDESGVDRVEAWSSTDAGATFARSEAPGLAELDAVGPLNTIDGSIRGVGRPIDDGAPAVIASDDGVAWTVTAPDLGAPISTEKFTPGPIEALDIDNAVADSIIGYTDDLARIALPATGSFNQPTGHGDVWFSPRPMVLNGSAVIVAENARSFIAVDDVNDALGGPALGATGPMPTAVDLDALSTGPAAVVSTYPNVEFGDEGRFSYSNETDRAGFVDGAWTPTPDATPDELDRIVSSGTIDLAYGGTDDPADDDLDGPAFGTSFSIRADGGDWSAPELLLTGPGGDNANAVIAVDGGFLLAGVSEVNSGDGSESAAPILKEYRDGAWTDLAIEIDLGDRVYVNELGVSDDGVRIASGSYFDGARFRTMFLSPDESGTWVETVLPTETTDIDVFEVRGSTDAVEVYTREDDAFFRYTSADGSEFDRTAIVFDELYPSIAEIVEVDDRTLIVGTRGGLVASTLTVWELADDGTTAPIELDGAPTGSSLDVDDAIVVDGALLAGGRHLRQSVVWRVAFA